MPPLTKLGLARETGESLVVGYIWMFAIWVNIGTLLPSEDDLTMGEEQVRLLLISLPDSAVVVATGALAYMVGSSLLTAVQVIRLRVGSSYFSDPDVRSLIADFTGVPPAKSSQVYDSFRPRFDLLSLSAIGVSVASVGFDGGLAWLVRLVAFFMMFAAVLSLVHLLSILKSFENFIEAESSPTSVSDSE